MCSTNICFARMVFYRSSSQQQQIEEPEHTPADMCICKYSIYRCVYVYIHIFMYTYVYIYIYIHKNVSALNIYRYIYIAAVAAFAAFAAFAV